MLIDSAVDIEAGLFEDLVALTLDGAVRWTATSTTSWATTVADPEPDAGVAVYRFAVHHRAQPDLTVIDITHSDEHVGTVRIAHDRRLADAIKQAMAPAPARLEGAKGALAARGQAS